MPTETCNRVLLDRYFLGEIQGEEKRGVRLHLDGCPDCRARLATLESERRVYLLEHPFRDFAARRLPAANAARKSGFPRWLPALAGVAACLMILPVLEKRLEQSRVMSAQGAGTDGAAQENRVKGGPILEFYCRRDGVVQPGQVTESYRAGDELQFVYGGGSYAYVTLASIDARGLVSLYRPEGRNPAVSIEAKPGSRQTLPFAVTLDDSPGSELFVLTYSSKPMTGEAVEAWLKGAFTQASGNLEAMRDGLDQPSAMRASVKALLLRKSRP